MDIRDFKSAIFSRRSFILLSIKALILFGLAVRLFFLQILQSKKYKTLSERNRIKFFLLEPRRGLVCDRNGVSLAENKINYQLYFYRQRGKDYKKVLGDVFKIISLSQTEQEHIIKTISKAIYLYPVLIQEMLSWRDVVRIESENNLPGVYISKGYMRFYPLKNFFAHTVGYVGIPNKEEIEQYKLQRVSGFRVGKTGTEKEMNDKLIGGFGVKKVEVNAYRSVVRELDKDRSVEGDDISISIDSRLQEHVYNTLKPEGSSAVVIEVETGNIVSMVSRPSFDPNMFSFPISKTDWKKVAGNEANPLTNRVINQLYPPGSVWKVVTSLAILRAGVDPNEEVICRGSIKVGSQVYRCWKKSGHGRMNMRTALYHSCNTYFYKMGRDATIDNIHSVANTLGFGEKTGVELPGELAGINPSRRWKEMHYNSSWLIGDTVNHSIGQGYNLVTPMQLAVMMSRISSGFKIKPSLYKNSSKIEKLDIPEKHLNIIRDHMNGVFNNKNGTGYNLRITEDQYKLAGKSGTAQVVSRDTLGEKDKSVRSHAVFAAYAPVHKPKYAIAVVADNAGWGVKEAAPLGIDILYFAQTKL